jgi:hypothetical protein
MTFAVIGESAVCDRRLFRELSASLVSLLELHPLVMLTLEVNAARYKFSNPLWRALTLPALADVSVPRAALAAVTDGDADGERAIDDLTRATAATMSTIGARYIPTSAIKRLARVPKCVLCARVLLP